MKRYFAAFIVVSMFILIAVSVTGAAPTKQNIDSDAANPAEEPLAPPQVATMVMEEGRIEWQPIIKHSGMVLTISGPEEFYLRQTARSGNMPIFFVEAADGTAVPDGSYTYELLALPIIAPEVQEALTAARANGDDSAAKQLRAEGKLPQEAVIQSGYFTVLNSAIVQNATAAEPFVKEGVSVERAIQKGEQAGRVPIDPSAQTIATDLNVQGSICVGQDCTSSESFSFDTLRLKENNLRIKADDTSNSASFPRNDWQITFNDSGNGGANKFAIDDVTNNRTPFTIEASAPSNSLYVDDAGKVGLGTATPVVELHVVDGDTATLRLEQDGSSGFTPQTWDIAGNETNFFIRDVTNGSKLPFRIKPNAPKNSIFIAASGDIGMGTETPGAELHISESSPPVIKLTNTGSGVTFDVGLDAGGGFIVNTNGQAIPRFRIDAVGNMLLNGTLTQLGNSSRAVKDRTTVSGDDYLARLQELEISSGVSSESVRHLAPDATALKLIYGLGDGKGISPLDVASLALSSTQALQTQVQQQETIIAEQQQQIDELEARLAEIEALLAKISDK